LAVCHELAHVASDPLKVRILGLPGLVFGGGKAVDMERKRTLLLLSGLLLD
jgi:hypothetical protein